MLDDKLDSILPLVEKPGRYIGGEVNSVTKPFDSVPFRMAFAFADLYEIAMSHLGMQILYGLVNARGDSLCERAFMPAADMETRMSEAGLPLFSLESKRPLADFDTLGFSLQYEVCYPTVLRMLDLAGIPRRRADRDSGRWPLLIAGGPCAFNPEPLADFFDLFFVGDAEETLPRFIEVCKANRSAGRRAVVSAAAREVPGVYAPEFYAPRAGRMCPTGEGLPATVRPAIVRDLENAYFPTAPVIPFVESVHERISLELLRGCSRGCRFCQAGMTRRPVRSRSVERLLALAEESYRNTGFDDISLLSLATGDYPRLLDLTRRLNRRFAPLGVGLSFPSLRADTALSVIPAEMAEVRKGAVTIAAEAGTAPLRASINKCITEEGILAGVRNAFEAGWTRVKLYFMAGLPGETLCDVAASADLVRKIIAVGKSLRKSPGVSISVAPFIPKPGTPFQWEPMASREYLQDARDMLRGAFRGTPAKVSFHDINRSFLEGALARGGRDLCSVLEKAADLGCRLDAWDEYFDFSKWQQAFASAGLDLEACACRRLSPEEPLPWSHISPGVSEEFLLRERDNAAKAILTPDCRESACNACGLSPSDCPRA